MPNRDFLVDQPGRQDKAFKTEYVPVETGRLVNLSVFNDRKLHFQANICKAFAEDKSTTIVET